MVNKSNSLVNTRVKVKKEPHFGVSEECLVNRRINLHLHRSGSGGGSHVAIVLRENEDLNKPRGVKTLLSGLLAEVSALVKVLSRRK